MKSCTVDGNRTPKKSVDKGQRMGYSSSMKKALTKRSMRNPLPERAVVHGKDAVRSLEGKCAEGSF